MATENLVHGHGDKRDFVLGTSGAGWNPFEIVRFRATEALGKPFAFEITGVRARADGPLDLPALLNQSVTLRIASENRWRPVHGLIVGAEELERTSTLYLYRFAMAPPSYRMTQRVRYRTFVDQTLRQILVALLENRSVEHPNGYSGLSDAGRAPEAPSQKPAFESFAAALGQYRFAVSDSSRLDDAKLRSYVVQYGESDHDLFHRLLEEEGLTYVFEHADDAVVLAMTDRPGQASSFEGEESRLLRSDPRGANVTGRDTVRSLRSAERMIWGGTTTREWDPLRSQSPQRALAIDDAPAEGESTQSPDAALFMHDQFPSRDPEVGTPCVVPATLAVERRAAERSRRVGRSSVRSFEPGLKITLSDDTALYDDQVIVITQVTTYATQRTPEGTVLDEEPWGLNGRGHADPTYENEFHALPEEIVFRPELSTRRPRIHGVQTAVVSADEVAGDPPEIHINELSQVRLRFPWDERIEPLRPSSCWTRVSQAWAGAGYGDIFVPRVGQEVLVSYLGGDPERPLVVGRVYNATNPSPYAKPTISTLKSKSSPDSDGYNELRFDDEAGNEEVYIQAEKNLNELVKANHSTSVGGNQSNSVGGNQSDSVDGNQTNTVKGDQSNTVNGKRDHTVDGSEKNRIGSGRGTTVIGNDQLMITETLDTVVKGSEEREVLTGRTTRINSKDHLLVEGVRSATVVGSDVVDVTTTRSVTVKGAHTMMSMAQNMLTAPQFVAEGGKARIEMESGKVFITDGAGASITLSGGNVVITGSVVMVHAKGPMNLLAGGSMNLTAGAPLLAIAPVIKLNG